MTSSGIFRNPKGVQVQKNMDNYNMGPLLSTCADLTHVKQQK